MSATVRNIEVNQGSKLQYTIAVTINGAIVDLSGYTAKLQARIDRRVTSPLLVDLTSSPAAGLAIVGPSAQIQIDVAGAITWGWTWRVAQYDLSVRSGTGDTFDVLTGEIHVRPTVLVVPV